MSTLPSNVTKDEYRDHAAVADEGEELLVVLWDPAYGHDPRETARTARVLVIDEQRGHYTRMSSIACDSVVDRGGTRPVKIGDETFFRNAESGTYRLETLDLDYYVEKRHIHRVLRVPRSGVVGDDELIGQDYGPHEDWDPSR